MWGSKAMRRITYLEMRVELDNAMRKIESGVSAAELNENERFIFPQVLINAMIREGMK